jgi:anti-sigma factor RsiW
MSAAEMSCKELVEVITDYLEGDMLQTDRVRFEAHLEECPWCRNYLEQMRETVATLGELTEESIDPAIRDDALRAFRDWRRTRGRAGSP